MIFNQLNPISKVNQLKGTLFAQISLKKENSIYEVPFYDESEQLLTLQQLFQHQGGPQSR